MFSEEENGSDDDMLLPPEEQLEKALLGLQQSVLAGRVGENQGKGQRERRKREGKE